MVKFDTYQCSEELLTSLRGNNPLQPIAHRRKSNGTLINVYSKKEAVAHFKLKLKKYANHSNMQRFFPKWERALQEIRSFT